MYLHKNPFLLINIELIKINTTGISLNTNSLRVHFIAIINNPTITIILWVLTPSSLELRKYNFLFA